MGDAISRVSGAGEARAALRLLGTSDLHVQLLPYDYYADRPWPGVGLSRTARLIAAARAGVANTLLFDNGDFLQGNPLGDFLATEWGVGPGRPHPMIAAMNALGYDAATLGNHEFDYGLDFLERCLAGAGFPLVSANLWRRGGEGQRSDAFLPPYVVLDRPLQCADGQRRPFRLGLIGFLPPQVTQWNRQLLGDRLLSEDIVAAAETRVPALRAEGCDLVLALCHSGIGPDEAAPGLEQAAVPLAAVPGIDAVIAGHSHGLFPLPENHTSGEGPHHTLAGKPAVLPGALGTHLGVIDLDLRWRAGQGWTVAGSEAALWPLPDTAGMAEEDPAVTAAAVGAHAAALAYIRRPVADTDAPLTTHFALVADSAVLGLVGEAKAAFVARALEGTAHAGLPVLATSAPLRAGGLGADSGYTHVPAGEILLRHVADLYAFPNLVAALRLTGAQLALWLERSAALFNRLVPGQDDQPLLDPAMPSYNFDAIWGLSYRIDATRPARFSPAGERAGLQDGPGRIRDLSWQGRPVEPDQPFILATSNYRAHGGGRFPGCDGRALVFESVRSCRDVLLDRLRTQGRVQARPAGIWSLAPSPGTSALFRTAPDASAAEARGADARIESAASPDGTSGWFRIRL